MSEPQHPPTTQDLPEERSPQAGAGTVVLLVADPGLPTDRAESIPEELQQRLEEVCEAPVRLDLRTSTLRLRPDGTLDLSRATDLARSFGDTDVTLLLTEIPRLHAGRPLIAEIFPEQDIALLSCPTLGVLTTRRPASSPELHIALRSCPTLAVLTTRRRVTDALMSCVLRTVPTPRSAAAARYERRWSQWRPLTGPEEPQLLQGSRVIGGARTVAGMVAGNEPFRTAPKLSGALAAATATGAFGIFYNSIWSMSMYLPTPRLLLIGLLAMLVITTWLIVGNRLWDEPKHERLAPVVLLYNLSTVLTLLMMVGLL